MDGGREPIKSLCSHFTRKGAGENGTHDAQFMNGSAASNEEVLEQGFREVLVPRHRHGGPEGAQKQVTEWISASPESSYMHTKGGKETTSRSPSPPVTATPFEVPHGPKPAQGLLEGGGEKGREREKETERPCFPGPRSPHFGDFVLANPRAPPPSSPPLFI